MRKNKQKKCKYWPNWYELSRCLMQDSKFVTLILSYAICTIRFKSFNISFLSLFRLLSSKRRKRMTWTAKRVKKKRERRKERKRPLEQQHHDQNESYSLRVCVSACCAFFEHNFFCLLCADVINIKSSTYIMHTWEIYMPNIKQINNFFPHLIRLYFSGIIIHSMALGISESTVIN